MNARRPPLIFPATVERLEPRTHLSASLVADLNADPASPVNWHSSTRVGDALYFTLHSTAGVELWKSDGTPAGTRLLRDINPGVPSSAPNNLTPLDDHTLLFSATTETGGHALWRSDGTRKGTIPIKPFANHGYIQSAIAAHGRVFFSVTRGDRDFHEATDSLWVTDGTTKGTRLLLQPKNLNIREGFVVYKRHVLFTADVSSSQQMLFATNGTRAGTNPLPNILINNMSIESDMHVLGQHLVYNHPTREGEADLWKTNLKSVRPIKDLGFLAMPHDMTVIGDKIYFSNDDEAHGDEPWVTDGTGRGTYLLKDIATDRQRQLSSYPNGFFPHDGAVYFYAHGNDGERALYKTDATPDGTVHVGPVGAVHPDLLFAKTDANDVLQIWHAPTPDAEAQQVTHFTRPGHAGVHAPLSMLDDRRLLFIANDGNRDAVWMTDGTADGTRLLRRIPHRTQSSDPSGLGAGHDAFYFGLYHRDKDPGFGPPPNGVGSLWKRRDGKTPEKIADLDGTVDQVIPADGFTYFTVRQHFNDWGITAPLSYYYLWRTDGTPDGTYKVFDETLLVTLYSTPPPLIMLDGELYYPDPGDGSLSKTDGTQNGSQGVLDAGTNELILIGQDLFVFDDEADRIWLTDGTAAGNRLLVDYGSDHDRFLTSVARAGGRLYFIVSGYDEEKPDELWTSDGTLDGTRLVRRFASPESIVQHDALHDAGDFLLFTASDPKHGHELWRSDGTPEGTHLVKDIKKGSATSWPRVLGTIDGITYFVADDPKHGRELWRTDGTPENTKLVADIRPGIETSRILDATVVPGALVFAADDGTHGLEPWILHPGKSPTLLADIYPGRASSDPVGFAANDDLLYFSANDDLHGREIWSAPL